MRLKHPAIVATYAAALALLLCFIHIPKTSAIDGPDLLNRRIKATAIKGQSIDQVLDLLAVEYGIPIGIELGDPKLTPHRQIDLHLPETTVKNFLDSAIANDSRYTWRLEGGVIHLTPVIGRDTVVANLLKAKISHFAITGEATRYAVCSDIMNLPEIRSQLVIEGVDPMILANFGSLHKFDKTTFIDESNLTLRELLDRIVSKTNMKRWVIARWGDHGEFITLRS